MFDTILIANRGEIAARVIRTARRLGIRTVAVHSDADAKALHVALADEAVCIGPAAASESYLRGDTILEVARLTGAQAIHPGYGFLSENAGFAAACADSGITFIGPPIEAIRVMGSKAESKRVMSGADVPLVPGYHGTAQDLDTLAAEAGRIGYPVLVKASAGGGGKGMRVVRDPADFADAVAGARREAKAAFGDDSLLLEKYLTRPRHVEIQVFADTHGNAVYLFERDCSLQRRHQKVIEEAPAPSLPDDIRRRMGEAAVAAARAVNYVGAGTVEFLYEDGRFYFIEMNTRLQVEHPVTEMITGQDLVEWQIRVASGQPLPLMQDQLVRKGHAFEARLYAEDPQRDFLPQTGRLVRLRPPAENAHVRVDTGVREGDSVTVHYDPMIAKLIVWDETRDAALRRLHRALADYQVVGVTTNVAFLTAIAGHAAFKDVEIDTGFIERHRDDLLPPPAPVPGRGLVLAALAVLMRRHGEARAAARTGTDPHSPWLLATGWRLNDDNHHDLRFLDGEALRTVTLHFRAGGTYEVQVEGEGTVTASSVSLDDGTLTVVLGAERVRATVVMQKDDITILPGAGLVWRLRLDDPAAKAAETEGGSGKLTAPMPGTVVRVLVDEGQDVERGAPLMLLEAMKMEHTIKAPAAGRVTAVNFAAGDQVAEGVELLSIEIEEGKKA
ncbi:3-methylcrotonyl-CoA carboxylase alpha subunit [Azospirillum fermentarium]|uniref:acetyl-CoA carboxylase biotin carboxylase subunit n=1 Tax=Azospirillum fermentarium TaxID=1233114 RepID=UPI0022275E3F|nr:acetyl/propionyl/methylcrotonyl-CoA carboxylase subunit alpha [Azospirillum fermentarium]MCW2246630.1 3-methylcrotonyl-CoA carboxylase alpha subunit [Azospirillum fermentarium]